MYALTNIYMYNFYVFYNYRFNLMQLITLKQIKLNVIKVLLFVYRFVTTMNYQPELFVIMS